MRYAVGWVLLKFSPFYLMLIGCEVCVVILQLTNRLPILSAILLKLKRVCVEFHISHTDQHKANVMADTLKGTFKTPTDWSTV